MITEVLNCMLELYSLRHHAVDGLLAAFRQQFGIFHDFTAHKISEAGEDILADMACANRITTDQSNRSNDSLTGDSRTRDYDHFSVQDQLTLECLCNDRFFGQSDAGEAREGIR